MNFFQSLSAIDAGIDITLKIKGKNGKLTVMVTPEKGNAAPVFGKIITAAPEELDNEFFTAIRNPPAASPGLNVHDLPVEKKDTDSGGEAKKENKSTVKKADGKKDKKAAKKMTAPVAQERSMFDQPSEPVTDETEDQPTDEEAQEEADETDSETE